jgi:predicted nucleic acid-binding protein
MIVADASVIANYVNPAAETNLADAVFERDPIWYAPSLWRYELRNTLLKYIRIGRITTSRAEIVLDDAMKVIADHEQGASTDRVLQAAVTYKISAYDAEYVALAQQLRVPLVTFDQKLVRAASRIALSPADFLR